MHIGTIAAFTAPVLGALALQTDITAPAGDLVTQLFNMGIGGLIAVVFYWQWQREIKKREAAERRERDLLRHMINVPPESGENDETIPDRASVGK